MRDSTQSCWVQEIQTFKLLSPKESSHVYLQKTRAEERKDIHGFLSAWDLAHHRLFPSHNHRNPSSNPSMDSSSRDLTDKVWATDHRNGKKKKWMVLLKFLVLVVRQRRLSRQLVSLWCSVNIVEEFLWCVMREGRKQWIHQLAI